MFGKRVRDEGYNVGMAATVMGAGIGGMLAEGHRRGMASMRAAEDARQQAAYDAAIAYSLANGEAMAKLARELADKVARLTAENVRLRCNLEARQTALDALRNRK